MSEYKLKLTKTTTTSIWWGKEEGSSYWPTISPNMAGFLFVPSFIIISRRARRQISLSFFWKQRQAVMFGVLLLVVSQIIFYLYLFKTQNSTDWPRETAAVEKITGNLNLHLWLETCAKDLHTLCNFPMFPKAPDEKFFVNKTIIYPNDSEVNVQGLRLFGYITPWESGLYLFMVNFCSAEIWLGENETWTSARIIYSNENLRRENNDSRVSRNTDLRAGKRYYVEVVATCLHETNKLQVLWKTPTSSTFKIINESFLSHYYNDSGLKDFKTYDESLPDSPACASRRHQKTYFETKKIIRYLVHDDVKGVLPYCEYKPSYTVNHKVGRWEATRRHVVHTFIYPFPVHPNLHDQKHWIFPLGKEEALQIVDIFMELLKKANPGKFELKEVRNVERKIDKKRGNRYFIEAEIRDLSNNKSVLLSEYVFMPIGTKKFCYPKNFQWNTTVPVYLVVTAKNLGRWLHHFIKNVERILTETNDPNLHVIIYDYNSSDINLEEVLKQSSLINYMLIRQSGEYSRTQSFTEAINLVSDPQSIIFMVDLHLHIASPLINNIRKHCIEGRMVYTPIIVGLNCGANPADLAGVWRAYGYGMIGMYKSDWDSAGGFPRDKKTWGEEDLELVDQLFSLGIEFERMRTTHIYHYHHSKKGLW